MTILFIEHLNINAIVRKMLNFKRCHPDLEETEIHIRMINYSKLLFIREKRINNKNNSEILH